MCSATGVAFAGGAAGFSETAGWAGCAAGATDGVAFASSKLRRPELTVHAITMRSKFLPVVPATYFLWATSYDTLNDRVAAITYYHHFLESAGGKFPNQEWQARQRLLVLEKKK